MKYLKYFEELSAYETYKNGSDYIEPNISYIEENKGIVYIPKSGGSVAYVGASIYGLDGKFYTPEEWTLSGKSGDQAVGVAVSNGRHSFVIHPSIEQGNLKWSNTKNVAVPYIGEYETLEEVEKYLGGRSYTSIIINEIGDTIVDAPAAQYANSIVFAHGKNGYLPAAGELKIAYNNITDINNCIEVIGGIKFDMDNKSYWSSNQHSEKYAWCWFCDMKSLYYGSKSGAYDSFVRPFATL